MVSRKKTDVVQLSKIRMREDLRRKLAKEAERKDVTLNGEIVARLEQSFEGTNQEALTAALVGGGINAYLLGVIAFTVRDLDRKNPDWRNNEDGRTEFLRGVEMAMAIPEPIT
jgi:Arc-like DNA binding domain